MEDCVSREIGVEQPLLTVVVPVYNVAPYLERTLQSVVDAVGEWSKSEVRSRFDRAAVEVICVDDGSTDGSGRILDKYVDEEGEEGVVERGRCSDGKEGVAERGRCSGEVDNVRFVVIHQKNAGVSAARNAALDRAQGEWVMMIDGDDGWAPDLLVKLFAEIAMYPDCDAVGFGMVVINEKGECKGEFGRRNVVPAIMQGDEVLLNGRGPYSKFIWSSCDKVYRRSVIERILLRYAVGMKHMEDSLFSQVFFAYAGKVVLRPDILGYRYLMREGSAIHVQQTELPEWPFGMFETLYAHWKKLKTPGLRLRLYYSAAGLPTLGKGPDFAPTVRPNAINLLLDSETFNCQVMTFVWRYGGVKSRMFASVYLLVPRVLRRKLLERL